MIACKVVAAWWFWTAIGSYSGYVVGPFETQAQCEKIRMAVQKNTYSHRQACVSDK